jgi:hypothetical protein
LTFQRFSIILLSIYRDLVAAAVNSEEGDCLGLVEGLENRIQVNRHGLWVLGSEILGTCLLFLFFEKYGV